jgi:hypothetical protein
MRTSFLLSLLAIICMPAIAQAQQQVRVTVENLQPSDGFYLTPVWVGLHDGGFDFFDDGGSASSALEDLAEEGIVSGLQGLFSGSGQQGVLANADGFGGAPVLDPGESASTVFSLGASERFLSFASMIIPSNDGFFGNDSGTAIEVLDADGNFSFSGPIELTFAQAWDAGTEVNDGLGAAFSATGGTSTDETNGIIALHEGFANFDNTDTADGSTINFGNASNSPVLRISVTAVPEPTSLVLLSGLGILGMIKRRRR